ncbi:MAG: methyltransferase [Candidatus Nanoarchaeia archaeon]|jgi:tRNA (guanine37-N1)-methyltransferase
MSNTYEVIGNIAVVAEDSQLGKELIKQKNITTVAKRTGEVSGKYRIKKVKVILGEKTTKTIHKENGVRLKIDLNKAYFSPRLQTERQRVMEQVKAGEVIIDMFAGVGPYSIAIAKKAKMVYAIDHNQSAIKLLEENITLNKLTNIKAMKGDALELIKSLPKADRIIMNAPRQNNQASLDAAKEKLKRGGIIHYYTTTEAKPVNTKGFKLLKKKRVIDYAPGKSHECLDLKKKLISIL